MFIFNFAYPGSFLLSMHCLFQSPSTLLHWPGFPAQPVFLQVAYCAALLEPLTVNYLFAPPCLFCFPLSPSESSNLYSSSTSGRRCRLWFNSFSLIRKGHRAEACLALAGTMSLFSALPQSPKRPALVSVVRNVFESLRLLRRGPQTRPFLVCFEKALISSDWQEERRNNKSWGH